MSYNPNNLSQFWQELKRRKVTRTITVYAAAAFVILELVSIIVEPLRLPEWTLTLVIVLLSIGFIIAVILSWIYDIHPEGGIVKTESEKQVSDGPAAPSSNGWRIASYISFVVIVGLIILNIFPRITGTEGINDLEKSIAVLPFENWSVDEAHSHLGNALANEIITELYKVRNFNVISYTSASRYKDKGDLSIPQIGQELGANFIIEGTVERQNENVSIHVQLIQAGNDNHIWANEFTGEWKDIFRIQDDIALNVAEQMKVVLSHEEKASINEKPTRNSEAYNYYLKGLYFYEFGGSTTQDAIGWFEEAIRLDSSFALPWTYLSMCYWRQTANSRSPQFEKGKQANERALELDPDLSIAMVNKAEFLDSEYDFKGAEEQIKLALKTDPNNQYVLRNAARFYTLLGRHATSIAYGKQALEDDPTNNAGLFYLIRAYFYAGQFEDAWSFLTVQDQLGFTNNVLYYQILLEKGQHDRIINEPPFQGDEIAYKFGLAAAYFKSGNREMAEKLCDHLKESGVWNYSYHRAMAHAYGDEAGEVCKWLEKSYEAREGKLIYLAVDPAFEKFRDEPQIKAILQKMGLPYEL